MRLLADMRHRGVTLWLLFFAIAMGLVLAMQGFVVARVVPQVEAGARDAIDESLQAGLDVWARRSAERAEEQSGRVALIVKDQGLLELLNPAQLPPGGVFGPEYHATLASAMASFQRRAGFAWSAMVDDAGELRFRDAATPPLGSATLGPLVRELRARGAAPRRGKAVEPAAALAVVAGRPLRLVMVDLGTQDAQRWLVAAYTLEDELAALHDDLRLHALLRVAPRGSAAQPSPGLEARPTPAVLAATAGLEGDATALASAAAGGPDAADAATPRHAWRVRAQTLAGVGPATLELRVARTLDSAVLAGAQMRRDLWAAGGLAIAAFGALLWALSRHLVAASLADLVRMAQRVGGQDYDAEIRPRGPVREVRQLAGALEQMRLDLRAEEYFDRRLTALPNRRHFTRELERALAAGGPVAVLLVGLNRFKEVNRRIGWSAGDRLLQAMAQRLRHLVPHDGFCARLGGDVFAVLAVGAGIEAAQRLARGIGFELEQPLDLAGHRVDRQVAVGIVCAGGPADEGADAERLLNRAEIALSAAKERREAVLAYDPVMDRESEAHLSLLSELRHARTNGELRLHLQPKIDLRDGSIAGAEALLRWEHPQRGLVPPGRFIPYAEDTPLIRELTLWVFEAVLREQQRLRAAGIASVSVNLSARDLMDRDLPSKLQELLARHGGDATGLCLETTESAVVGDIDRARQTLEALRAAGFRLSIDDFGEGQTSLRYLQMLPVHELKIDMVFVKGMQTDRRTESIVKALVEVGHQYGLSVVAEGVENATVAQRLAELGCDEGQGWHFGKPQPVEGLLAWARARGAGVAAEAPLRPATCA